MMGAWKGLSVSFVSFIGKSFATYKFHNIAGWICKTQENEKQVVIEESNSPKFQGQKIGKTFASP